MDPTCLLWRQTLKICKKTMSLYTVLWKLFCFNFYNNIVNTDRYNPLGLSDKLLGALGIFKCAKGPVTKDTRTLAEMKPVSPVETGWPRQARHNQRTDPLRVRGGTVGGQLQVDVRFWDGKRVTKRWFPFSQSIRWVKEGTMFERDWGAVRAELKARTGACG